MRRKVPDDDRCSAGAHGTGFRPSPYVTPEGYKARDILSLCYHFAERTSKMQGEPLEYEVPHLVMTYTALLSLAMLRDDFSQLDRPGILKFLAECQQEDGWCASQKILDRIYSNVQQLASQPSPLAVNQTSGCCIARSSLAACLTIGLASTSIAPSRTSRGAMLVPAHRHLASISSHLFPELRGRVWPDPSRRSTRCARTLSIKLLLRH